MLRNIMILKTIFILVGKMQLNIVILQEIQNKKYE